VRDPKDIEFLCKIIFSIAALLTVFFFWEGGDFLQRAFSSGDQFLGLLTGSSNFIVRDPYDPKMFWAYRIQILFIQQKI
jgi:hypothetical protein